MGILKKLMDIAADELMTKKVKAFKGVPFGKNDDSEVYADLIDLNGFRFLTIKILGPLNIKTYKGCFTHFKSGDGTIKLEADTMEIETDYSQKIKLGITRYDIDLTEELERLIRAKKIFSIQIVFENKAVHFDVESPDILINVIDSEPQIDGDNLDDLADKMGNNDPYPYK